MISRRCLYRSLVTTADTLLASFLGLVLRVHTERLALLYSLACEREFGNLGKPFNIDKLATAWLGVIHASI